MQEAVWTALVVLSITVALLVYLSLILAADRKCDCRRKLDQPKREPLEEEDDADWWKHA